MSDQYLVWSNEHSKWWKPGGWGYTAFVGQAGVFTREQALEICRNALGTSMRMRMFAELPVRLEDVSEFTSNALVPSELVRAP